MATAPLPTRAIHVQWIGTTVGRGVVAARDFEAGEVVFEEDPLAAALLDPSRCDYTFAPSATLRSSKSTLRFSSQIALRAAWGEYFKTESKVLGAANPEPIPPSVRAAMRLCWRGDLAVLGELETHWDKWPEKRQEEFLAQGTVVSAAAGRGGAKGATPEACARLLAALAVNSMTVTDEVTQRGVATAFYQRAARLNHDEDPNAVQTFRGRTFVLRALRPIQSGDEIRITYVDPALPVVEQRKRLLDQYHFDAYPALGSPSRQFLPAGVLRVATRGAEMLSEQQLKLMAVLDGPRRLKGGCDMVARDEVWAVDGGEKHWEFAAKMVFAVRAELEVAVKAKDLRLLRALALSDRESPKGLRLGKTHAVRVEAARELLDAAVDAQAWDVACSAAEFLAEVYQKINPECSVATGVVEAKLAKLLLILENGAAARRHAKRALHHLERLLPESTLIREARGIIAQVTSAIEAKSIPEGKETQPAEAATSSSEEPRTEAEPPAEAETAEVDPSIPETPEPETPEPETPEPETPEPETPEPETAEPGAAEPETPELEAAKPGVEAPEEAETEAADSTSTRRTSSSYTWATETEGTVEAAGEAAIAAADTETAETKEAEADAAAEPKCGTRTSEPQCATPTAESKCGSQPAESPGTNAVARAAAAGA